MDDYNKLPSDQAKECKDWDERQEEEHASMHSGGINEAYQRSQDAEMNADAEVKPLLAKLTSPQRAAYLRLLAAFHSFLAVQVSGGKLYLPPYAGASFSGGGDYASSYLHAHFDLAVAQAIRHRTELPGVDNDGTDADLVPGLPSPSFEQADTKLNTAWQHLAHDLTSTQETAQLASLRTEQRAWLKFRDSFAAFALTVAPAVPRSKWLAALEANRAEEFTRIDW